jgi:tetratricopeptide (TPR) repeat protein
MATYARRMSLRVLVVFLVGCSGPATTTPPTTPPSAPRAATEEELAALANKDGDQLFAAKEYGQASNKYLEATARVPDPKYFFNLCMSYCFEGKLPEAATACRAVSQHNPTPELVAKADKQLVRIHEEAKKRDIDVEPQWADAKQTPLKKPPTDAKQAQLADTLNQEGVTAMNIKQYAVASTKFRDAVARDPDPKYFYNLCTSLYFEGKFGEALTACNVALRYDVPADLKAKTEKQIALIKDEAKRQNIDLTPFH